MAGSVLGTFIRERRESVTPEQVGLPPGGRRRTPGLRRAELATLSGVSIDYLTRLEQGRDTNPSAAVLAALADTLLLSDEERGLLMRLGAVSHSAELCPRNREPERTVRAPVRALLDAMEPSAAVVVNRLGDVVAWTDGWAALVGGLGLLDDDRPNLVRHLFTDPRARTSFVSWERAADDAAATLMADNMRDDAHLIAFVDEVVSAGGSELQQRLDAGPSVPVRSGVVRLVHPVVGDLRFAHESLEVAGSEQRLLAYLPFDEPTAGALHELRGGGTGRLHAVPS